MLRPLSKIFGDPTRAFKIKISLCFKRFKRHSFGDQVGWIFEGIYMFKVSFKLKSIKNKYNQMVLRQRHTGQCNEIDNRKKSRIGTFGFTIFYYFFFHISYKKIYKTSAFKKYDVDVIRVYCEQRLFSSEVHENVLK